MTPGTTGHRNMLDRQWAAALAVALALLLAGCTLQTEDESRNADAADARQFTVDLPEGATKLHVDASATRLEGEPDVTVLVEDQAGNNLATDTWSLRADAERRVTTDVAGHDRVLVTVRVVDGDAELDVRVSATVPSAPEPVFIVHERVVIVQVVQATPTPAPASPAPSPTPASPTAPPAATPTPSPTPAPPANTTNSTDPTNTTG